MTRPWRAAAVLVTAAALALGGCQPAPTAPASPSATATLDPAALTWTGVPASNPNCAPRPTC